LQINTFDIFCQNIYLAGMTDDMRKTVWPYLLGFYSWTDTEQVAAEKFRKTSQKYDTYAVEWLAVDAIVKENDRAAFRAGN